MYTNTPLSARLRRGQHTQTVDDLGVDDLLELPEIGRSEASNWAPVFRGVETCRATARVAARSYFVEAILPNCVEERVPGRTASEPAGSKRNERKLTRTQEDGAPWRRVHRSRVPPRDWL